VRTAGVAEGLLEAAQGSKDYLFLTLGTGVGAAVVLHGAAYVGARDVAARTTAGDPVAKQVWGEAIDALSMGIANYITLLDPERVVIGGGMADAGQMLFEPLIARLAHEVTPQPVPPVLPAALGNDAGYLGAALKAWLALGVPQSELKWPREAKGVSAK
jgi:predicted NBD/HSP70 family sugar kinase